MLDGTGDFDFGSIGSYVVGGAATSNDVPALQAEFIGPRWQQPSSSDHLKTDDHEVFIEKNSDVSDSSDGGRNDLGEIEELEQPNSNNSHPPIAGLENDDVDPTVPQVAPGRLSPVGFINPPAQRLDTVTESKGRFGHEVSQDAVGNTGNKIAESRITDAGSFGYFSSDVSPDYQSDSRHRRASLAITLKHDPFISMTVMHGLQEGTIAKNRPASSSVTEVESRGTEHLSPPSFSPVRSASVQSRSDSFDAEDESIAIALLVDDALTDLLPEAIDSSLPISGSSRPITPDELADAHSQLKSWDSGTQFAALLYVSAAISPGGLSKIGSQTAGQKEQNAWPRLFAWTTTDWWIRITNKLKRLHCHKET